MKIESVAHAAGRDCGQLLLERLGSREAKAARTPGQRANALLHTPPVAANQQLRV